MSASFSYAQVGGTLGRDAEIRAVGSGKRIASFSLAVEKGWGDKKRTDWFTVSVWEGTQGFELVEKYFKKGKSVAVSGDLEVESWQDKQTGQTRTATKIIAKSVQFLESGKSESGSRQQERPTRQAPVPQTRQAQPAQRDENPFADPDADDIPF